jgi:hypothetical protein
LWKPLGVEDLAPMLIIPSAGADVNSHF